MQAYNKEDTSKMPLELGTPLSYEREPEMDPKVRVEAAEAIYLIALQVYFLVRFLWHTYCLLCVKVFQEKSHWNRLLSHRFMMGFTLLKATSSSA